MPSSPRLVALFCAACVVQGAPGVMAKERAAAMFEVESDGRTANAPIALSSPFAADHGSVETAIVFVHGAEGDAPRWRRDLDALAARRGLATSVYVAVPQFLDEEDVGDGVEDILTARWSGGDWIDGATASRPTHILSYHVVDAALRRLADAKTFPKLKRVTVAGFSGGGSFVQRYAVVTDLPERLEARGVAVRFVVGSAESFLYFGAERPTPDGGFAVPPATVCETYNDWPYGPREAPNALKEQEKPVRFFAGRYAARDVVYVVGARETEWPEDAACGGAAEGQSRAERLASYWRYMKARWPDFSHKTVIVPAFGHDRRMFLDRPELFDLMLGWTPPDLGTTLPPSGDWL